jgi:hypothetical protein
MDALEQLIQKVMMMPVLGCPNLEKQSFLKVDASAFTLGTILFQYNDKCK